VGGLRLCELGKELFGVFLLGDLFGEFVKIDSIFLNSNRHFDDVACCEYLHRASS